MYHRKEKALYSMTFIAPIIEPCLEREVGKMGNFINVSVSTSVRTRMSRDPIPTMPVNRLVVGSNEQ